MSSALFDLKGRRALVTGSSQGIGLVLARGLAEAGATVVLNGRDAENLARSVAALKAEGLSAHGCAFDVTDAAAIDRGMAGAERDVGPIDILVNNAGIQRRGPLEAMEEAAWREVLDTNLTGAFLVARRIVSAPAPVAQSSGTRPMNAVATVIVFGRMRFTAPSWMACHRSFLSRMRPSRLNRSKLLSRYSSMTMPVSASSPASAMMPTHTASDRL
jgi:NAD(P)-dependent dehydrogenase (short-subunit alcohol dehydrogenase family)